MNDDEQRVFNYLILTFGILNWVMLLILVAVH